LRVERLEKNHNQQPKQQALACFEFVATHLGWVVKAVCHSPIAICHSLSFSLASNWMTVISVALPFMDDGC